MGEETPIFEFRSGGAYHFQGFGEWIVSLDSKRSFAIQHNVRGDIKDYGSQRLSPNQAETLWGIVREIDFEALTTSTRMGVPDESRYGFTLREGSEEHQADVWAGEALRQPAVSTMLEQVAGMIKEATGIKPVLK